MKMKRLVVLFVLLMVLLFNNQVLASDFRVPAKSAILVDGESGQILMSQNADEKLPPASITKIMTLLLVMEDLEAGDISLEDEVFVSQNARNQGGSQIWLNIGDSLVLKDMLKAAIIPSANDATVALAEHVGGTKSNFVRMMNQRAQELGLKDTYFANSTGLPHHNGEDSYTTALDIIKMAQELIKYDLVLDIGSRRVDRIGEDQRMIYTTNNFIGSYRGGDGLKTGWTTEAGYCLVGTAQNNGQRLISVVLGANSDSDRVNQTTELLNYGFRAFHREDLINQGSKVAEVKVENGKEEKVNLLTANSFTASIRRGTKDLVEQEIELKDELQAPISKGDKVGKLFMIYDGDTIGSVDLIIAEDVERASFLTRILRWIRDFIIGFFN